MWKDNSCRSCIIYYFKNLWKVKEFKIPNEFLEVDETNTDYLDKIYKPSGPDGLGWGRWRNHTEQELKIINL